MSEAVMWILANWQGIAGLLGVTLGMLGWWERVAAQQAKVKAEAEAAKLARDVQRVQEGAAAVAGYAQLVKDLQAERAALCKKLEAYEQIIATHQEEREEWNAQLELYSKRLTELEAMLQTERARWAADRVGWERERASMAAEMEQMRARIGYWERQRQTDRIEDGKEED